MNTTARAALMTLGAILACACGTTPVSSVHHLVAGPVQVASQPDAAQAATAAAEQQQPSGQGSTQTSKLPAASPAPGVPRYPQYAAGSTPAPATATLTSDCVRPGGAETLTIVTEPDFVIGFDAQYADGKDGRTYGGMDSNGRSGPDGKYTSTWVVAPTAPAGQVIVWIAIGGGGETAFRQPTFTVQPSC